MGIYSSVSHPDYSGYTITSTMKLLVLSSVIAVALCAPDAEAEADAHYGQYQWPGSYGVSPYGGFSSTCYGCRPHGHLLGKRSAEAEAHYGGYGRGVAAHPGYGSSFVGRTAYGYPSYGRGYYGKRSADAEAAPEASYGKRSAEPHGVVGHVHGHGHGHGFGLGVAGHPGHATSYVGSTVFGYPSHHYGKRSAEAEAEADAHYGGYGYRRGYGGYAYGSPYGYGHRRGYYGKRSAEAEAEAEAHYGGYGYGRGFGGYAYGVPGGYTHVSNLGYGYGR